MATIDIKIQNRCDHRLLGEIVQLEPDGRTLHPLYPIAADGAIELRRSNILLAQSRYSTAPDPRNVLNDPYRKVVLAVPDIASDPYYEITYTTFLQYCPKCSGESVVDDIAIDSTGKPKTVSNTGLLAQSVEKAIITAAGSNRYHRWVGSRLNTLIGTKVNDQDLLVSEIKSSIRESLDALQEVQIEHMQVNNQVVNDEVLGSVESIDVVFDVNDPSIIRVAVDYTSRSGLVVNFTQELELASLRARG